MRTPSFAVVFALAAMTATSLSSCKPKQYLPGPSMGSDEPGPGDSSGPFYYTHHLQLEWDDISLARLVSIKANFPGEIQIDGNPNGSEFVMALSVDVQPDDHEALEQGFDEEIAASSDLIDPAVLLKMPERDCSAPLGSSVHSRITGICVRKLQIIIPPEKRLAFFLAWQGKAALTGFATGEANLTVPEGGSLQVTNVAGSLWVDGGSSDSTVNVNGLGGEFTALHGNAVGNFILREMAGAIDLQMDAGSPASVMLDGEMIHSFPYQRPASGSTPSPTR